jgi:transposase
MGIVGICRTEYKDCQKFTSIVSCPDCGENTDKLHQNYDLTIRDINWGEQEIYLRVNRRQMRCEWCGKKFREELDFVKKKRNYPKRFQTKIV